MLQVLRKLEGATPSQRKQFRANEKARLQDLVELEVKNLQCLRLIPDVFLYHSTTHFENDVTFLIFIHFERKSYDDSVLFLMDNKYWYVPLVPFPFALNKWKFFAHYFH